MAVVLLVVLDLSQWRERRQSGFLEDAGGVCPFLLGRPLRLGLLSSVRLGRPRSSSWSTVILSESCSQTVSLVCSLLARLGR